LAPRPQGERPAEMVKAQANASVNRLFIAVCDRCETERGVAWIGGSVIVDADGYPLTQSLAGEGMVLASMDIGAADDKHIGRHNHVHRDRRPMLY
ncbi:TPA: carbon-nitrogen hydrolase, partial [Serratia marcescens]